MYVRMTFGHEQGKNENGHILVSWFFEECRMLSTDFIGGLVHEYVGVLFCFFWTSSVPKKSNKTGQVQWMWAKTRLPCTA